MATTGYAVPALPPKQSRAGLNFLQKEDLKQEFRKTLIELIRVAPPQSLGVLYLGNPLQARKDYVEALIKLLEQKPYLVAELDKENGKTSRISYSEFTKSDKQWVRQVLEEETKKLRLKMDDTAFKSRLERISERLTLALLFPTQATRPPLRFELKMPIRCMARCFTFPASHWFVRAKRELLLLERPRF